MSKIILKGFIKIPNENLGAVLEALKIHTQITISEPGCLVFEVHQDRQNPNRLNVYEEFINQAAFEFHQQRVSTSDWGRTTKGFKREYQITSL